MPIASPVETLVGFAGSQSPRRLAADLDDELDVLAVVEEALGAGASTAAVAPEDLVERLFDRD